jgi:Ras-related protein Rab-8A
VGKSCLLLRFADDQFSTSFITTIGSVRFSLFPGESARASLGPARARALEPPGALGAARAWRVAPASRSPRSIDFKIKTITLDSGKKVKLQIWDTAGQERFRTITTAYYRGAMGILLVYDVTNEQTFLNVKNWMRQIDTHAAENVCRVLIGNKCDVPADQRVVSYEQGKALADEFGVAFFETSAKENLHVDDAFMQITNDIVARLDDSDTKTDGDRVIPGGGGGGQKKSCCK